MEQMVNEALELLSKSTKKIGSSTVEKAKPYFQLSDELLKVCDYDTVKQFVQYHALG